MAFTLGQRLFAHGGVYVASRLANRSISIVLLPLYAHYLGTEGVGMVRVLAPLGVFASLLLSQGLAAAWFRLRFDQDGFKEMRIFETTIVWYLLLTTTLGIIVVSLIGDFLSKWVIRGIPFYPLGFLTLVGAGLNVFVNLYERKLQAEQRPIAFSIFSGVRTLLTLLTIISFVALLKWGVLGKVTAESVSALALASGAIWMIRPLAPNHISKARLKECLAFGLPIIPHSMAVSINEMVGILVVNGRLGLENAGIYAVGLQFAAVSTVLAVALNQAYSPMFVKNLKESDRAEEKGDVQKATLLREQVARSNLLMPAIVGCFGIAIACVARDTIQFLTPEDFHTAWKVVCPITGGIVAISFYSSFNQSVFYNPKRVKWVALVSIATAIINIFASFVLVGWYGLMGAAFSGLISNTVMAFLTLLLGKSATQVPYRWMPTFGVVGLLSIDLIAVWYLDALVQVPLLRFFLKLMTTATLTIVILKMAGIAPRHLFRFANSLQQRAKLGRTKK